MTEIQFTQLIEVLKGISRCLNALEWIVLVLFCMLFFKSMGG